MKVDESRDISHQEPQSSPSYNVNWLRRVIEAIYIRKKIFLVFLVLPPCIALVAGLLMPRVYRASTTIWAQEQRSADPFRKEQNQLSFLKDQQALILSNVVTSRVLEQVPPEVTGDKSEVHFRDLPPQEQAVRITKLLRNVDAKIDPREGGSNFIELKVKARSPEHAAYLANLFAQTYIDYYFEVRSHIAHGSYKFLENQLVQVSAQLRESEERLQAFETKMGHGLIHLIELIKESGSQSLAGSFRFMEVHEQLAADWAERSKTDALYKDLIDKPNGMFIPLDNASKNLSVAHLQDKLVDLRSRLTQVRLRWADSSPEVRMLESEIESAESLLLENRNVETQGMKEKLSYIQERAQQFEQTIGEIAANRVTYENLRREVTNHSEIYRKVQQELESSRMAAEMSIHKTASIVVIDRAVPPLKPVFPNWPLNMGIGGLLGVGISLWLVLILASLDKTIRRPEQLTRFLGIDVLGSISTFQQQKNRPEEFKETQR